MLGALGSGGFAQQGEPPVSTTPQAAPRPWLEVDGALRARFEAVRSIADAVQRERAQDELERDLRDGWKHGTLSEAEWRTVLLAEQSFELRARWPLREPLVLSASAPHWLRGLHARATEGALGRLDVADRFPALECGLVSMAAGDRRGGATLGPLLAGADRVRIEVEIPAPALETEWERVAFEGVGARRVALELPIEPVASAADVLPRFESADFDLELRSALVVSFERWSPNASACLVARLSLRLPPSAVAANVGVELLVESLRDGEPVGSARFVLANQLSYGEWPTDGSWRALEWLEAIPPAVQQDAAERARWSLRVSGRPEGLLSLWRAQRWYAGGFEMPLAEALGH